MRRRRNRLAALLLPALVLRAFVPFGFMPLLGSDGLSIGFCPGEATLPPGIAIHQAHGGLAHEHLHHGGGNGGDAGGAHHAPCLFAASANAAFAHTLLAPLPASPGATLHAPAAADAVFLPSIYRAQSQRGPPQIA